MMLVKTVSLSGCNLSPTLIYLIKMGEKGSCYLHLIINPFMLNIFSHPYQFYESISNFRVVGWDFSLVFKL